MRLAQFYYFRKFLARERTLQMPLLGFSGAAYKLTHWNSKKTAPPLDLVSPHRQNNPLSRRLFTCQDSLALTVSTVPSCQSARPLCGKTLHLSLQNPAQSHARPPHAAFFTAAANRLDLA